MKTDDKDSYSLGVSNEERNASAFARFNMFLFWGGGALLTILEGLSK